MDPLFILPIALAVAWAATRKPKSKPKAKTAPKPTPTPTTDPWVVEEPPHVFDGPQPEPWRPGGPNLPKPPSNDGPTEPEPDPETPEPFPGPGAKPRPPHMGDPRPIEVYPGTTHEQLQQYEDASYALFITTDCQAVFEGEHWFSEVFLPRARDLVETFPEAVHHPVALLYELLVGPQLEDLGMSPETATQACTGEWEEFALGGVTIHGTFSGWVEFSEEYDAYQQWHRSTYPAVNAVLWDLYTRLWLFPDLAAVFEADWPEDETEGDIDFDPTGT
ncbi:MAG: hypothetical protein K0V04_24900 [Deltaproteobacteria bacterium]|nr:hypothetical protein [Deltaproteobacteria bacterium]